MAKTRKSSSRKSGKSRASGKSKTRRPAAKRDRVSTRTDTRYVKRTAKGRFKESDDAGRSQKTDKAKRAKKRVRSGYGDQGDRKK